MMMHGLANVKFGEYFKQAITNNVESIKDNEW
jgi:hypothetical protein